MIEGLFFLFILLVLAIWLSPLIPIVIFGYIIYFIIKVIIGKGVEKSTSNSHQQSINSTIEPHTTKQEVPKATNKQSSHKQSEDKFDEGIPTLKKEEADLLFSEAKAKTDVYEVYKFDNGETYQGEWKDNKPHGIGTYVYCNGHKYTCGWKNGKKSGQGIEIWDNGIYVGSWLNDKRHGNGMLFNWKFNNFYEGEWEKGYTSKNGNWKKQK